MIGWGAAVRPCCRGGGDVPVGKVKETFSRLMGLLLGGV